MGVPVVDAPRGGGSGVRPCVRLMQATALQLKIWTLTFGTPRLIRHLMQSSAATIKTPSLSMTLASLTVELRSLPSSSETFVYFSDANYTTSIRGIGQLRAYQLISKHKFSDSSKISIKRSTFVPDDLFEEARELFEHPMSSMARS